MFGHLQHNRLKLHGFHLPMMAAILFGCASLAHAQFGDNPFSVNLELQKTSGATATLMVKVAVPADHYLYAAQLRVAAEGDTLTAGDAPPPKPKRDPFSGDEVGVYDHDVECPYRVAPNAVFPLKVTVEYQGCNDTLCFMPQTETYQVSVAGVVSASADAEPTASADAELLEGFRITGRDSGFKKSAAFIAFIDRVEAGEGLAENPLRSIAARRGVLFLILSILLGGLALNLTPCVLPMIPVNIAIIGAGTQAGSRSRGFALGATYGLGISLVYGVLGVVVVLTGSPFGTLNASPWFNLAIAVLFAVLALAMFGVFNIDLSRFQSTGPRKGGRGPFVTAFAFGGVAALLAGACVAPVLIGVLVLSTEIYQRGAAAGLLLPFVLGLGMALPWPFAGAGLSFLPKPGRWMERIKIGFGIVILAAAAYYGTLGVRLLAPPEGEKGPIPATTTDFTWTTSWGDALAMSQASGKPIFIDVWATWCKSCKVMNKTTLQDPAVLARLGNFIPLKYQAENPKDPETKRVLDALGVKGQPFYVVLEPQ